METNQEPITLEEEMTQGTTTAVEKQAPQSKDVDISSEIDTVETQDSNVDPNNQVGTEEVAQKDVDAEEKPMIDAEYVANLFEQMIEKFDKKILVDDHKNLLFDKMYAELNSYKKDIYAKLLKPFIMEVILLIEDTSRFVDTIEEQQVDDILKIIKNIPCDLINLLEVNDVELYEDEQNLFNPRTQKVIKKVPTSDLSLNNMIAERVRKGYKWNDVVIRHEIVNIYKYISVE